MESKLSAIKHLEEEMLHLGTEIKAVDKEISELKIHPENLKGTTLFYLKRLRWLDDISEELNKLYRKVNSEVKKIIELLYRENKTFSEVCKLTGKNAKHIRKIHTLIVNVVAEKIGLIEIKSETIKEKNRYLSKNVKKKVWERYKGKCAVCGSEEKIHYHHIEYYSEGGNNTTDNLMLLCASCHAEEHKGERAYYALIAMAEG